VRVTYLVKSKEEDILDCLSGNSVADSSEGLFQPLPAAVPLTTAELQQISPTALAYLGDAVYELYVRSHYLLPPKRSQTYHRLVVAQVRAETQARHLRSLTPHLNNTELEIVRRGRNAAAGRPRRVEPEIYQQATSLETLIGYLYLTDSQRLTQLLQKLKVELNPQE
jgi:ribonuclease-3 family protein